MPAMTKLALATALALPLAGGATALAQSTATPEGHTRYVTLTIWEDDDGSHQVLDGTVPCEAGLVQQLKRAWMNRPACTHEGYAWAYPSDQMPPWEGEIEHVNDTRHVTEDGQVYHTTEIVYRAMTEGPDGGVERVRAVAGELKPIDRSIDHAGATYSLPVRGAMLGAGAGAEGPTGDGAVDGSGGEAGSQALTVEIGPAPQPSV